MGCLVGSSIIGCLLVGHLVWLLEVLVGRLVGRSVGRLVGWWVFLLVSCMLGSLVHWIIG